jgi:hypothetical protein
MLVTDPDLVEGLGRRRYGARLLGWQRLKGHWHPIVETEAATIEATTAAAALQAAKARDGQDVVRVEAT